MDTFSPKLLCRALEIVLTARWGILSGAWIRLLLGKPRACRECAGSHYGKGEISLSPVTLDEPFRRFFSLSSIGKPVIGHSDTGPPIGFLLGGISSKTERRDMRWGQAFQALMINISQGRARRSLCQESRRGVSRVR